MSKLSELMEILKEIDEVKEITDLVIKESYPYIERIVNGITDLKIRSIKKYMDNGFTKEEAILLTIDSSAALIKSLDKTNTGTK